MSFIELSQRQWSGPVEDDDWDRGVIGSSPEASGRASESSPFYAASLVVLLAFGYDQPFSFPFVRRP